MFANKVALSDSVTILSLVHCGERVDLHKTILSFYLLCKGYVFTFSFHLNARVLLPLLHSSYLNS